MSEMEQSLEVLSGMIEVVQQRQEVSTKIDLKAPESMGKTDVVVVVDSNLPDEGGRDYAYWLQKRGGEWVLTGVARQVSKEGSRGTIPPGKDKEYETVPDRDLGKGVIIGSCGRHTVGERTDFGVLEKNILEKGGGFSINGRVVGWEIGGIYVR